jgi:hypoxanthine-guanine phosphoribosyltransferase
MGYIISYYLINNYDIETKYPKLKKKIIKYYNNSSLIVVAIESIICVFIFNLYHYLLFINVRYNNLKININLGFYFLNSNIKNIIFNV